MVSSLSVTFFSRLRQNLKWASALLVAGASSIWTPHGWSRIGRAFALFFFSLSAADSHVNAKKYRHRMEVCRRCPLFYKPLEACGTPLKKQLRGLGCYCYMPEKAKLEDAVCWIDSDAPDAGQYGWKHARAD